MPTNIEIDRLMQDNLPKEAPDFVVCKLLSDGESYFTDDKFGTCVDCSAEVRYRPYVPDEWPKICMACVMLKMPAGGSA